MKSFVQNNLEGLLRRGIEGPRRDNVGVIPTGIRFTQVAARKECSSGFSENSSGIFVKAKSVAVSGEISPPIDVVTAPPSGHRLPAQYPAKQIGFCDFSARYDLTSRHL